VVVVAVYAGAFGHDFVRWDDPTYVQENPLVVGRQAGQLLTAVVARNFHPATMLSMALNVSQPLSARPFLITNVLLHALNTILIFWLAFLLLRRKMLPAFFVALLFAVHPMHVESVAWVSERKDVLYAFFFLAAAIAYWTYLEKREWAWLAATFGLFLLSCLSKAVAVVFPAVMVLLDYGKRRAILDRRALLEKAPFLATSLLFGLIAVDVQGGGDLHGLLHPVGERLNALPEANVFTPLQRLVFPAYGHLQYVWKLFVPLHLSAFYRYPASVAESYRPEYLVGIAFLLATVALFLVSVRRWRLAALGLGWYFATLLPVMQWMPVGSAIMADRYTYLPYFGLFLILVAGLAALVERRPSLRVPVWTACALFALFLTMRSVRQVETWKDTESLWSNVIRNDPRSDKAFAARGNFRGRAGRVAEAMSDLQTARLLNPRRGEVYEDLGNAYGSMGRLDSAVVLFGEALRIDPTLGHTYYNRAIAYLRLGRPREALADLAQAETLMPGEAASLHFPRGNAYASLGDDRRAAEEFDRAIEAREGGADAYVNRGLVRMRLGDAGGAAADFQEALRLDPNRADAQAQLQRLTSKSK
jgi:tetratricopeptide (TPR) repeat protein